jgi:hypothetical protein
MYEDVMGEFDMRVLAADLASTSANTEILTPLAVGWGGDRFRVYETPAGPAMVWYIAWDDSTSRTRFLAGTGQRLESRRRLGYRLELTEPRIGHHPGTRIVIAPEDWLGWRQIAGIPLREHRGHCPRRTGRHLEDSADEIEPEPKFIFGEAARGSYCGIGSAGHCIGECVRDPDRDGVAVVVSGSRRDDGLHSGFSGLRVDTAYRRTLTDSSTPKRALAQSNASQHPV